MIELEGITIDPEFCDLMPSREDDSLLREKIEREGWSDEPITVWQHHGILLDGHRRYAIWKDRGDGGPPVRELRFETREEAFHWVVNNQLARRNLTDSEQRWALGLKYKAEKGVQGGEGNKNASKKQKDENHLFVSGSPKKTRNPTRKRVATEAGTTESAIQSANEFAEAVEALDHAGVVPKADILSEKITPTQKAVREAAKLAEEGKIEDAKVMLTTSKRKTKESPTSKPADSTDKQHEAAVSAISDACNFLQRSKLIRLRKTNPSRKYAFNEVIRWLNAMKKAT